ncbi:MULTISPECIES: hypothetical protein [unclassified Bacillus (in: firmicutes)]|uniref:hypothetical protein n=1 Tax=unclassified Bacillus (in: firmicutes) TaxID=185979 RepID=UPI00080ADA09|nr:MULTISPECIES: hypothetical protein [unclassified Bacillus (in: firmicutes)]OCA86618.1 hypothetical protein A8L44_04810 [Bacillus sp. FJAT-27986]
MMKRFFIIMFGALLLTACSNATKDTNNETTSTTTNVQENDQQEVNLEFTQEKYYIETGDDTTIYYYAELENTSNIPAVLYSSDLAAEDKDGNVLGAQMGGSSYPHIVNPGEKTYISNTLFIEEPIKQENIAKVYCVPEYDKASEEYVGVNVENPVLKEDEYKMYTVTGKLVNSTDEEFDASYAAVLLDENNQMVAVLSGYADSLKKGQPKPFETYEYLPEAVKGKVKSVKVISCKH